MNESCYPVRLEELIDALKALPGVGRRGAERMALAMLKWEPEKLAKTGALIAALPERIGRCPECGAIAEAGQSCRICAMPGRDRGLLCVVEDSTQVFAIEKSGHYRGVYHVLGGRLSPLDHENGENMSTAALLDKAAGGAYREIILALSSDVEGRATAVYLGELLRASGVKVSQPALGLPAGASLSYADAATISAAFSGRREFH